jgi:acetolactate synthase-1/2/3 large subunit
MSSRIQPTGASMIAGFLKQKKIARVFLYPGGTIAPILDELEKHSIKMYTARTEQGAGFAAIGASKVSGRTEVVLVSSGPGVTNLVTCVADAFYDSTPIVAICGQVGISDFKGDLPIRQLGFQEVDTEKLLGSISKKVFTPKTLLELRESLPAAFSLAHNGRPGPVVVNIHMNLQRAQEELLEDVDSPVTRVQNDYSQRDEFIDKYLEALSSALKPLIIVGQGVIKNESWRQVRQLAEKHNIPVSHSLLSLGVLPGSSPLNLGFHGHTGTRLSGKVIQEADLILVIGSRLDVRQTGTKFTEFASGARIFRVDLDSAELNHARVSSDENLLCSCEDFLPALIARVFTSYKNPSNWVDRVNHLRKTSIESTTVKKFDGVDPELLIRELSRLVVGQNVNLVTGVGSHQQWTARNFEFDLEFTNWLTSGGLGTMGYDIPVAIGAQIGTPSRLTICVVGDGSFQMNIQELAFIAEHQIPLKIVVMDNSRLGIVSQFQKINWKSDPTCGNKINPDFEHVARAFNLDAKSISENHEIQEGLSWLMSNAKACLLNVKVDSSVDVLPMLLAGDTPDHMWPYEEVQESSIIGN